MGASPQEIEGSQGQPKNLIFTTFSLQLELCQGSQP